MCHPRYNVVTLIEKKNYQKLKRLTTVRWTFLRYIFFYINAYTQEACVRKIKNLLFIFNDRMKYLWVDTNSHYFSWLLRQTKIKKTEKQPKFIKKSERCFVALHFILIFTLHIFQTSLWLITRYFSIVFWQRFDIPL